MADSDFPAIERQFHEALVDCRRLYHSAADQFSQESPAPDEISGQRVFELMDDLHKGLLVKIYGSIAQADHRWTPEEERLAAILFEHLWGQQLSGEQLREAALHVFDQGNHLKWYSLVRPFEQIPTLRERVDELETIIMRLANLVAKCDGVVTEGEAAFLRTIEEEISIHLRPLALAEAEEEERSGQAVAKAVQEIGKKTTPAAVTTKRSP